jgi:Cu+-exporting ATPase
MHMQYKVDPDRALAAPSFGRLYALTAVVGLLVAADLLFWWLGYENLRNPYAVNLALIAAVLGGGRIIYGALVALLEGDVGADLALAVAMLAALVLKEYWVGAEVVLIAMVGESLEAITFSRTHREIRRILELRPRTVRLRQADGQDREVPIEQVECGDVVVVRPGERIPVDGTVLAGRSTVDQSTLTGESLPIDKGENEQVFAGTLNQFGALDVRTDAVGDDTTLGQVIQLVASAQQHKAPVERTADRLARYFLPMVMTLAAGTFLYTNFVSPPQPGANPANWVWMPTLAVLVVTCPCALVLATPATMMAALAWLARRGILIKSGAALESLASVNRLAFDKTGTLTIGKPELADCVPLAGQSREALLAWAASAEQSSEHVIAQALVRAAREQNIALVPIQEFNALPGAGVSASIQDADGSRHLLIGNRRLMVEQGVDISADVAAVLERLEQAGQTPLLIAADRKIVGVIGVRDTVRPEAAGVIRQLRELGVEEIVLLTGDRLSAAATVARSVGIDRYAADLRPQEKADWLAAWRRERTTTGAARPAHVAMIGDGINDAPALASADVGLAIAGIGSDLAADAGDLLLMGDPLASLPGLLKLSRETVRIIRQNILLFAFFVNFLGIVLTAWVMPTWSEAWLRRAPIAAALFHQVGSVLVLLNAMRLLWFERWNRSILGRIENRLSDLAGRALAGLEPLAAFARLLVANRRPLLKAAGVLLLLAYMTQVVVIVQPDEVALVKRFGGYFATLGPGPHLRLPPPWDTIVKENPNRIRVVEVGLRSAGASVSGAKAPIEWNSPHMGEGWERLEDESLVLTGDESLVDLGATIQFRVRDPRAYWFSVSEPERLLRSAAEGVIREAVGSHPLLAEQNEQRLEILTTARGPLEADIAKRLQQRADVLGLGVEIIAGGVCLQDVHPPLAVVDAFRDVSSAFKEKERMHNEADALHRDKVIKAAGLAAWRELQTSGVEVNDKTWARLRPNLEGEAAAEILAAEAFATTQQHAAEGASLSFARTEAAQSQDPQLSAWRLLLDTIATSLAGKNKMILDRQPAGKRHLMLGLPGSSVSPQLLMTPSAEPKFDPDE